MQAPAPRLLYVVTEDWYFLSHRLPMARAARDAGFEVHVATRVVDGRAKIEAEGFMATVHGAMLSARAYGDPKMFGVITGPLLDRLSARH